MMERDLFVTTALIDFIGLRVQDHVNNVRKK